MSLQKVIGVAVVVGASYLAVKSYKAYKEATRDVDHLTQIMKTAEVIITLAAAFSTRPKHCRVEVVEEDVIVTEDKPSNVYDFPSVKAGNAVDPEADNIDSIKP